MHPQPISTPPAGETGTRGPKPNPYWHNGVDNDGRR